MITNIGHRWPLGWVVLVACAHETRPPVSTPPVAIRGIAYATFAPLDSDLFIANADGSDPRPLLSNPSLDYNASFSPDGRWIVFTSERDGSADLYRAHPDGTGLERLTDSPAFDDQGVLSPDGRTLAFVSSRSGHAQLWTLDLTTRVAHQLTNHPGGDFRPAGCQLARRSVTRDR